MKNLKKLSFLVALFVAFSAASMAQVGATATASATIITPIAIANATDMDFGNVAVSAVAGTVVLAPAGTRTATGGVTLPVVTGTVTAASFTVTGLATATYSITLPSGVTVIDDGVGNNMNVDTWTSSPTPTGTIGAGGTQTLTVGATLAVGAAQAAGTYTSATPFTVTVNYN